MIRLRAIAGEKLVPWISGDKLKAEKGGVNCVLERNKYREIEAYGNKRLPQITLSVWPCCASV